MLLITRRTDEGIVINGEITIRVVEVRGNRVKLGFDFPPGNTVYREELFAKIQDENRAAVASTNVANILKALPTSLPRPSSPPATKENNNANIGPTGENDD